MNLPQVRIDLRFTELLLGLLLLFSAPSFAQTQTNDYVLNKGDQILVTVWGYNEFTTTATIKNDGTITIPLLGEIMAAGLTRSEFIASMQKRLSEYIHGEIKITVSVLSSIGQRVTLLGAVARPDNYPITSDVTLIELLSMAGGYQPDAKLSKIKIFHKDKLLPPTEVDLDDYIDRADIENIPKVFAGDIVFVPRQEDFIKELGGFIGNVAFLFTLFRLTNNF